MLAVAGRSRAARQLPRRPGPGYCTSLKWTETNMNGRRDVRLRFSSARSNTMLVAFFVVALFATIVAMHRDVTRGANAKLRARFDAEGPRGELSRRLMRDAGYRV
jgi:hypothetical protein